MVKRKKTKSPKTLDLFGIKLDYKDYVERILPEQEIWIQKVYKNIGIEWNYKPTTKPKSKYWDCKKIYPTTVSAFKKKFFKKRKPKDLEGVWYQYAQGQAITWGIVKDGGVYQYYCIDFPLNMKVTTGSFLKDIFNPPGKTNYNILNGTKLGAFFPDKNDPKKFKFKGIGPVLGPSGKEEETFPVNYLMEYEVTKVSDNQLRGDADFQIKMEEYGNSRNAYKEWPEEELTFDEEETEDEEEISREIQNGKKTNQESKKKPSVGTGFFVTDKGHIITNFHVVKDSSNIKFLYDDEEIEAKLIASDHQLDLALLKAKIKNKNYIKFSNKSPQKTQNILVAGFPYGKAISDDLKITGGIINSLKGIGNNTSMLQIDATILPGNSGGPIVDKKNGSLVAVSTMSLDKDATKYIFGTQSENTNYGIKSSQVKDFLEANKLKVSIKKNKFKLSELEKSTVFLICK